MLHACFTPIYICLLYTLWHFYAFYGTNLLTSCHTASSLFSAVFVFQKSYTGNILVIGRDKSRRSYIYSANTKDREGVEDTQQGGHTLARRGLGLARAWALCGPPGRPPTSHLRLFIPRHGKTLSTRAQFHEKHRRHRNLEPEFERGLKPRFASPIENCIEDDEPDVFTI